MPSSAGPRLHSDILTPLQIDFLQRFFAGSFGPHFFLTGGTALAGFHLGHRLSDDLDLFTVDDSALPAADAVVPHIAQELKCEIIRRRESEYFRQYIMQVAGDDAGLLQVDLVRDFGPQYGEYAIVDSIVVDAILNIGANKLTAILGRTTSKDFVDLHFILKSGLDFDDLFRLAREKDTGLNEFFLAQALLQVRHLKRLPIMRMPIELSELEDEFVGHANRLLDRINPQDYAFR